MFSYVFIATKKIDFRKSISNIVTITLHHSIYNILSFWGLLEIYSKMIHSVLVSGFIAKCATAWQPSGHVVAGFVVLEVPPLKSSEDKFFLATQCSIIAPAVNSKLSI